jgi:peptide-methionine (S)-S-oxide reductase
MSDNVETAILAGGCFWGVQELLRQREGVISVPSARAMCWA